MSTPVSRHSRRVPTAPCDTMAIAPLLHLHGHRVVDSKADLGLRYSIYDKFSHMKIFKKNHYTVLTEPVVRLGAGKKAIDGLFARLKGK